MTELSTGLEADSEYRDGGQASLHPAEVDLLCTFAEVTPPFPLKVGALGDRKAAYAVARTELARRGLADGRGPRGLAGDLVHLLRTSAGAVDLMVARLGQTRGALVLAQRDDALLLRQDIGLPGARVHLTALSLHDAIEQLVDLVPEHGPGMAAPFSLSQRALDQAYRAIQAATGPDDEPRRLDADEVDRVLRDNGIDETTARRMTTHLQPVLGNGQAGAAERRGYADEWGRVGEELRWLDTARGRFRLGTDSAGWVSVNPLTRDDLRAGIRSLAAELWH
ncbi:ESX secretion-associated protein EspG [Actinokineospora globicatena]|uniref:ESX secretion-associated protein EspG n=1 Tax=Actinokineospora globicatena TaxID=103729 RepID=A0A9W6V7C9_9PSEU|nr:ESX secretion-associated protein EspG [Actinokineospora globicatena]GLW92630.1 ESX secretion-associated protein EspG [Actinokineospora globicatena]